MYIDRWYRYRYIDDVGIDDRYRYRYIDIDRGVDK